MDNGPIDLTLRDLIEDLGSLTTVAMRMMLNDKPTLPKTKEDIELLRGRANDILINVDRIDKLVKANTRGIIS